MSTAISTERPQEAELLPGYRICPRTGAWETLPWPDNLADLPPSLGPSLIRWGERWFVNHLTGEPWRYTQAQRRFIHLWYALERTGPDSARWLYRSGVKRGAKGTGKDPSLAALSLTEAVGPVRFVGWEGDQPVAVPYRMALVQIGANSEAQAKDVLRVANAMISQDMAYEFGAEPGVLASTFRDGARIELLTNSERSAEGDPATAVFLNETHHMTEASGGQSLAAVGRRNAGKSPGGLARVLEATNAHMPGEESVAEGSFDAWQAQVAGRTRRVDILYDSLEAAPNLRMHVETELVEGIAAAYRDAPWTDRLRILEEAQDTRTPVADAVRYYFNGLPTNEFAWIKPERFRACARADLIVAEEDPIAMFLDCSKTTDATVLSGCRISDGHVMSLGVWQRPHGARGRDWIAPREEVDAAARSAFGRWDVQWFGVDPSPARDDDDEVLYWAEVIDEWHRDFREEVLLWATPGKTQGHAVKFDMRMSQRGGRDRNRAFTEEAERTQKAIDEADDDEPALTHDGDATLMTHAFNARRRPNPWGMSLGKRTRDSSKLVDYAVSMVGARLGRRLVLNSGKKRRRKSTGEAVFV